MRTRTLVLAAALVANVMPLSAQSLANRVAATRDGAVTFHFTARPGVCGDGDHFIRTGKHQYHGAWSDHRGLEPCMIGPVQVRLMMEDGAVNRVQYWVGPLRDRSARELGAVPAAEAARYLLKVASEGPARASAKAIMPAVLADSAEVWPVLLTIAKDDDRSRGTRAEASLWLSRFASGVVAGHPNDPFVEDDGDATDDEELKRHAVFVLSQLPRHEGVPQLLEAARTNKSWRVRSQAMFWLGQSGDSRAIALFESVLSGR